MSQNGQTNFENLAAKCVWTSWDICIKGLMSLLVNKINRIPTTAFTLPNYNCLIKFYFWWGERVKITPPLLGGFSEIINWLFIYMTCEHQLLVKTQTEVQLHIDFRSYPLYAKFVRTPREMYLHEIWTRNST